MADAKVTGLSQLTELYGNDVFYVIDGASADAKLFAGDLNLLPDGLLWGGKFQVTVSSNNLTLALKTRAGNDPSDAEPVSVHIGGTRRRGIASLSVTKNAGTNWFASAAASFAGQERDYFVYLIWNTAPATDVLDIGFSPIPYARVYGDFSSTSTNERYIATANASTPNSTDECVVIGRFAATLSASPNFNWSVPTFTNSNLIQHPIFHTRLLTYAPTPTGYSSVPTSTLYQYMIDRYLCTAFVNEGSNGTSNSTSTGLPAPMSAKTIANGSWSGWGSGIDNGSALTSPLRMSIGTAASSFSFFPNASGSSTWTNSGGKRISVAQVTYPIV